ncbi:MAG TPA: hypothetical protein VGE30_03405 [Candidatus Saccharimonadales bacterium]
MPRFLLAGGLDHERAAFAAELASLWNDVPSQCEPYHDPVRVMTPPEIGSLEELRTANWVLHGNDFTRYQARAAKCATQVISIMFHESQIDQPSDLRSVTRGRDLVVGLARHHRVPTHILFDNPYRTEDELAGEAGQWSALSQMANFIRSQRLIEHRSYVQQLQVRARQGQK